MQFLSCLNLPFQLEKLITKNYYLHKSALEAYKASVRAYDSHALKQIFDINSLDLVKVGKSFGFSVPPGVDLSILCYHARGFIFTVVFLNLHTYIRSIGSLQVWLYVG